MATSWKIRWKWTGNYSDIGDSSHELVWVSSANFCIFLNSFRMMWSGAGWAAGLRWWCHCIPPRVGIHLLWSGIAPHLCAQGSVCPWTEQVEWRVPLSWSACTNWGCQFTYRDEIQFSGHKKLCAEVWSLLWQALPAFVFCLLLAINSPGRLSDSEFKWL